MNRDLLKQISDKKQKLIDAKNLSPFVKGNAELLNVIIETLHKQLDSYDEEFKNM